MDSSRLQLFPFFKTPACSWNILFYLNLLFQRGEKNHHKNSYQSRSQLLHESPGLGLINLARGNTASGFRKCAWSAHLGSGTVSVWQRIDTYIKELWCDKFQWVGVWHFCHHGHQSETILNCRLSGRDKSSFAHSVSSKMGNIKQFFNLAVSQTYCAMSMLLS